jgi:hypothetical protein
MVPANIRKTILHKKTKRLTDWTVRKHVLPTEPKHERHAS